MKAKIAAGAAAAIIALAATVVKPWEGISLTPYTDIVGVRTVCYGQTGKAASRAYTKAECDAMLDSELGQYLQALDACIDVDLRRHEWAALLSLAYNSGVPAICRSTLVRQINAGAPPEVWCQQFDRWVYAGGKRVKGLVNRRAAEKAICLGSAP